MNESAAVPVRDKDKSRDIRDMIERFLATSMNGLMERRGDGRCSALIKRGRPFISHSPLFSPEDTLHRPVHVMGRGRIIKIAHIQPEAYSVQRAASSMKRLMLSDSVRHDPA